jgi:soluble lytic murein transglycosylase-like protein
VTSIEKRTGPNAAVHPSIDAICDAIASATASNNLLRAFFTRLIWQESRFDPFLVNSKDTRGIPQFMPATPSWRG